MKIEEIQVSFRAAYAAKSNTRTHTYSTLCARNRGQMHLISHSALALPSPVLTWRICYGMSGTR
eukprot:1379974-Rhodomonas_salina.1